MRAFLFIFSLCLLVYPNEIKAQELTMFTGLFGWEFYQDDKKIKKDYLKKLLSDVPVAEESWKKANLNQGIGLGMVGIQIGFGVWLINNDENDKNLAVPAIGFAASSLSALVLAIRSITHRKYAILNYNRSFDKRNIGQHLRPASSGIGIAWTF